MDLLLLIQALFIIPVFTDHPEKYNLFKLYFKKGCCSGTAPTPRLPTWHPRLWQKTLREATYQSIMRHTEFTGTLDDRLNRDHQLWSKIKDAIFKEKSFSDNGSEITTGVLVDRQRRNGLEFQQRDKSVYECPGERCKTNDSLVAVWRVRKTQDPNGLWIRVKLPTDQGTPIEDVYEYNVKYGLKRLMKNKEIDTKQEKNNDRSVQDRMDVRFPDENMFMLNMPKQALKTHPAVIVETGRHFVPQPITNIGAIVATGVDGYRHVIHGLGPLTLPRPEFQQGSQYNGFLPSIGPIVQPPVRKPIIVYDTPQYNPSFINAYGQTNHFYKSREQSTKRPNNFKPSKEFIQFSEVDPFLSRNVASHTPQNKPFTINYPDSINAQLSPTVSSADLQRTTPDSKPFQIIVDDYTTNQPQSTMPQETKLLITPAVNDQTSTETSLQLTTMSNEETDQPATEINEPTTLSESILSNMIDALNRDTTTNSETSTESVINKNTETTEGNADFYTNALYSENILNSTLDIIRIMNETTTEPTDFLPTMIPEDNGSTETTTYRIPSIFDDVSATNKIANDSDFDSVFTSLTNKLVPIKIGNTMQPQTKNPDKEAQESLKEFRLLTYPGDPISIVEHRISTSVSYKTAKGKTGMVPNKDDVAARKKLTQLIFKNNNALNGRGNSIVGRGELNSILSHLVKASR